MKTKLLMNFITQYVQSPIHNILNSKIKHSLNLWSKKIVVGLTTRSLQRENLELLMHAFIALIQED
jgi:hypothetical protein